MVQKTTEATGEKVRTTEATGEKVRKPRGSSGPRPLALLFRAFDKEGNELHGVDIQVVAASRNAAKILAKMNEDRTVSYVNLMVE